MAKLTEAANEAPENHHKRTKSSVIKSMMTSRGHKRTATDGFALTGTPVKEKLHVENRLQGPWTPQQQRERGKENQTPSSHQLDGPPPIWAQFTSHQTDAVSPAARTGRVSLDDNFRGAQSPGNKQPLGITRGGPNVMAAVAAFNEKVKTEDKRPDINAEEVEAAFEAVLDSRNVPQIIRPKMRALDIHIKAAFIKNDEAANASALQPQPPTSRQDLLSPRADSDDAVIIKAKKNANTREQPNVLGENTNLSTPVTNTRTRSRTFTLKKSDRSTSGQKSRPGSPEPEAPKALTENNNASKPSLKSRPRSKTFTLSKPGKPGSSSGGASPKKPKDSSKSSGSFGRVRSFNLSSKSTSTSSSKSLLKPSHPAPQQPAAGEPPTPTLRTPEEYWRYLTRAGPLQAFSPPLLHRLGLLLNSEVMRWVDSFVRVGGLSALATLLYRIIDVEWRQDHDDSLLHEVLFCIKALCRSKLGLQSIREAESTLFPAVVGGLLFHKEKKGPYEYTTRNFITSILFFYLADPDARCGDRALRAEKVLSYLRQPGEEEEAATHAFLQRARQRRGYAVWAGELMSVIHAVFWVYSHPRNNIVLEPSPAANLGDSKGDDTDLEALRARSTPVPASPATASAEFESTTYLTSHLDLCNALLASLPSREARLALRAELRASGFERAMGYMRTCREKPLVRMVGARMEEVVPGFPWVHDGLRTWIAAARGDGWDVSGVAMPEEQQVRGKVSPKKRVEAEREFREKIKLPVLELDLGGRGERKEKSGEGDGDGWV